MPENISDDLVTFEVVDGIAHVGLNRPNKRNAISDTLVAMIEGAARRAEKEAKAAVLFGNGNEFCAGLDLSEYVEKSAIEGVHNSRSWHVAFSRIEYSTIPWISALHGAVIGGGLELAASTHIRVSDRSAFFAMPEGKHGIFLGGGGSVRIARLLGVARMMDMMLTGRVVTPEEAERWNLVQYVVEDITPREKAHELAKASASNAAMSNYAVINVLPRIQDMAKDDGLLVESYVSSLTATSPEAAERLRAFLEKRIAVVRAPGMEQGSLHEK